MNKEEILNYIEFCVNYHHDFDNSYKITDSAYNAENLKFLKAIQLINEIRKEIEK